MDRNIATDEETSFFVLSAKITGVGAASGHCSRELALVTLF